MKKFLKTMSSNLSYDTILFMDHLMVKYNNKTSEIKKCFILDG